MIFSWNSWFFFHKPTDKICDFFKQSFDEILDFYVRLFDKILGPFSTIIWWNSSFFMRSFDEIFYFFVRLFEKNSWFFFAQLFNWIRDFWTILWRTVRFFFTTDREISFYSVIYYWNLRSFSETGWWKIAVCSHCLWWNLRYFSQLFEEIMIFLDQLVKGSILYKTNRQNSWFFSTID